MVNLDFVMVIHDILELKLDNKSWKPVEATNILKAILSSIVEGLRRDGKVYVRGFGTFWIQRRDYAMPNISLHMSEGDVKSSIYTKGMTVFKNRTKVFFSPSIQLMAMINQDVEPNTKEARAQKIWNKE